MSSTCGPACAPGPFADAPGAQGAAAATAVPATTVQAALEPAPWPLLTRSHAVERSAAPTPSGACTRPSEEGWGS